MRQPRPVQPISPSRVVMAAVRMNSPSVARHDLAKTPDRWAGRPFPRPVIRRISTAVLSSKGVVRAGDLRPSAAHPRSHSHLASASRPISPAARSLWAAAPVSPKRLFAVLAILCREELSSSAADQARRAATPPAPAPRGSSVPVDRVDVASRQWRRWQRVPGSPAARASTCPRSNLQPFALRRERQGLGQVAELLSLVVTI